MSVDIGNLAATKGGLSSSGLGPTTIDVTQSPYNADPTGAVNASPAIAAAVAALPARSGVVFLPAGDYLINSTVGNGNGSASSASTRWGVILQGVCPEAAIGLQGGGLATQRGTRLIAGTQGMTMVSINGPLTGWGVRDIILDGALKANYGLREIACVGGDSRNVSILNCVTAGQITSSLVASGGLAGNALNHMRNRYQNFYFYVPVNLTYNFATGIYTDGVAGGPTDSWGDVWDQLTVVFSAAPTISSGITTYGIAMQACDSQTFRDVHFLNSGLVSGAQNYALRYDFTNVWNTFVPGSCLVDDVDFGTSQAVIVQYGSPTAAAVSSNRIRNIRAVNGVPTNPFLTGVEWEGVRTKAGAVVAADIAVGQSAIYRDTTNNTTKLYYNNAGVIMSVALA